MSTVLGLGTRRPAPGALVIMAFVGVTAGCDPTEPEARFEESSLTATALAGQNEGGRVSYRGLPRVNGVVVDETGKRWRARRVSTFAAATGRDPLSRPAHIVDMNALTDEELAEHLKPMALTVDADGEAWEYIALDADVESVRGSRSKQRAGYRLHLNEAGHLVEEPASSSAIPNITAIGEGSGADVPSEVPFPRRSFSKASLAAVPPLPVSDYFSPIKSGIEHIFRRPNESLATNPPMKLLTVWQPDHRQFVPQSQYADWYGRTSISLAGIPYPGSDGWCSGQLIGSRTAVTAAHCFWNTETHNWFSTRSWALGVVRTGMGNSFVYGPVNGCYTGTFPSGFLSTGYSPPEDFAIIEFGCGLNPGWSTGWMYPAYKEGADWYYNRPAQMQAYDVGHPLPPQGQWPSTFYYPPSMVTRSVSDYNVWVYPGDRTMLAHTMDVSRGSSGGGMLMPLFALEGDPTWYYVGELNYELSTYNFHRRLDPNMWEWVKGGSSEY